ncbi:MAG: hypothetical protein Q7U04_07215 [Bacteriovorax sp.]|nr:hypothetical protein [Bacteriovorax sp.]
MNKKLNTKFDAAESSPGFLFWKVANLHQRLQRQVLKDLDISPTQYFLLACYFFLKTPEGLPTQTDICEMAGLDKMLVSDTTKALLRKKLVIKKIIKMINAHFMLNLLKKVNLFAIRQ